MLLAERFGMTALALFCQDMLGTGTQVFGAPVTPGTGLNVFVAAGRIYSMAPLEPSAWSSLAADSTPILKQGILTSTGQTIAVPVLGTSGQSVNYLIEGQYQENDINPVTLSYFNASNPLLPFSGAGNNGLAQPTIRAGQFVLQAKAGTPATTGSQTTPAVDAGWTAIAVVTVAFGATSITTGNITQLAGSQQAGTFLLTGVGFSGSVTATVTYRVTGSQATLILGNATFFGTSNATTFTATGVPSFLQPSASLPTQFVPVFAQDAGALAPGSSASFQGTPGTISFAKPNGAAWAASGSKGASGNMSYLLY